jgi:hypothetical protein
MILLNKITLCITNTNAIKIPIFFLIKRITFQYINIKFKIKNKHIYLYHIFKNTNKHQLPLYKSYKQLPIKLLPSKNNINYINNNEC